MTNVDRLIKNLLEESTVTRNQILTAIKKGITLQVENSIMHDDKLGTIVQNVIPVEIDKDNRITGNTKEGNEVTFDLNSIISDLSQLKEEVKLKKDTSGNATITGLADADEKTAAAALSSVQPGKEITIDEDTDHANLAQEQSVENFENWCVQYKVKCGEAKSQGDDMLNYTIFIKDQPVEAFINSDGIIKIGGHRVTDENTFKNIIEFYENSK